MFVMTLGGYQNIWDEIGETEYTFIGKDQKKSTPTNEKSTGYKAINI